MCVLAVIFLSVIFIVLFILYSVYSEKTLQKRPFKSTETLPVLLVRVLLRALKLRQGHIQLRPSLVYVAGGKTARTGDKEECVLCITPTNHRLTVTGVRIDDENMARYKEVCGYPDQKKHIPALYPQVLFFRSILLLVTSTKFCLSPLGLIHIRERICQHDHIHRCLGKNLETRTAVIEYREYGRGVEVDIEMKLFDGNFCVWEAVTTLFSRAKTGNKVSKTHPVDNTYYDCDSYLDAPSDTGVRYARVSGDWNPHHIYWWTALPFGFKRPIAHGMWTLSRALAEMEEAGYIGTTPLTLTCAFKRPLLLPGKARIKVDNSGGLNHGCNVRVEDRQTEVPHLLATVKYT